MESTPVFCSLKGADITANTVRDAANLFSQNYGIWEPFAAENLGEFAQRGQRIKMSPSRLRDQCMPKDSRFTYVSATIERQLVGHVFAAHWQHDSLRVCWITQLVVKQGYRWQKIATRLLQQLKVDEHDHFVGILSSHPGAICAALRAFGRGIESVDMGGVRERAHTITKSSPVSYVRTATLHGSLFGEQDCLSMSTADTNFWVDLAEPLEAIAIVSQRAEWPFGRLADGHEFLALIEVEGNGVL